MDNIDAPPGWTEIGDAPTCVLPDGRLLMRNHSTQTAVFDPVARIWQSSGVKNDNCSEDTFTLLSNGNVLDSRTGELRAADWPGTQSMRQKNAA